MVMSCVRVTVKLLFTWGGVTVYIFEGQELAPFDLAKVHNSKLSLLGASGTAPSLPDP